jgi:hypothetical protein
LVYVHSQTHSQYYFYCQDFIGFYFISAVYCVSLVNKITGEEKRWGADRVNSVQDHLCIGADAGHMS